MKPTINGLQCPACGSTETLKVNPRAWACRSCKHGFVSSPSVELRYHVPKNQCYEGSRGRQGGNVHLHVMDGLFSPPLVRHPGEALCGRKRGWYEREPLEGEHPCAECQARAIRYGIGWPR